MIGTPSALLILLMFLFYNYSSAAKSLLDSQVDPCLQEVAQGLDIDIFAQAFYFHDFETWKRLKINEWQKENITDENAQLERLFWLVQFNIEQLKKNEEDQGSQRAVLFAYNFIREKFGLNYAATPLAIDYTWLNNQDYDFWKKGKEGTPLQIFFEFRFYYHRSMLQPDRGYERRRALYTYNLLREMSNQPIADEVRDIDLDWAAREELSYSARVR